MSYITVQHVSKQVKDISILEDINLTMDKNKIYGFVGKNGCGKTVLFKILCGLMNVSSGEVVIDDKKIGRGVHPKNVGLLIEDAGMWDNLSAFENLRILNQISQHRVSESEIQDLLVQFDLTNTDKKVFKKFSLGMKQKLRLAQAFMGHPSLIILDEPTNALDEESVHHLRNLILEEKSRGSTFLLASHASEDIRILCDEVIYMECGRIKTKEVLEQ